MMKNNVTLFRRSALSSIIAVILLFIIIAAPGCNNSDITKKLNTYKNEDTSFITKLADYKNLSITKDISVSDGEILDYYMSDITELAARNDHSEDTPVYDPIFTKLAELTGEGTVAKEGDVICFDYKGIIDGKPLDGGQASFQLIRLGAGRFIPGFEESIIGHEEGTEFPINVTFPSSYPQNRDLENKEVVFEINLRFIFPGITDESVKTLLEYEETNFNETKVDAEAVFKPAYSNGEEYVAYARKSIRDSKESSFQDNLEGYITEALYKGSEYSVVPRDRIDSYKASVEAAAEAYGISVDVYLYYAFGGLTVGEQYDELARYNVCTRGILAEIIKRENLSITQEEFDEKAAVMAENYGYDTVESFISAAGVENICNSIFIDEIMQKLRSTVKINVID